MKNNKFLLQTIIVFLVGISQVSGTSKVPLQPKIAGVFASLGKPDSVIISIIKRFNEPPLNIYVPVDRRGAFKVNLPKSDQLQRIHLSTKTGGMFKLLGKYYLEPNDNVFVRIVRSVNDSLFFSGIGAAKFNLINMLNNDNEQFLAKFGRWPSEISHQSINTYLNYEVELLKTFEERKTRLLNKFDKIISSDMRSMIESQYAPYFSNWDYDLQELYIRHCVGKPELELLVRKYFNNFKNTFSRKLDDRLSIFTPFAIKAFKTWHKTNLILNSENGLANLIAYYNSVKENSNKNLREVILATFFNDQNTFSHLENFSPSTYDSLVLDAQRYITSVDAMQVISSKVKKRTGSQLYDGVFIDSNENYVATSSLKGKVVFVDFWGEGCSGCLLFHRWFEKEIWPAFKGNMNFVYLSISIDKSKKKWKSNIERYSSKQYLNVNTDGLGLLDHPFAKYYHIESLPFMMLVDKKGRIMSEIKWGISPTDLINLIKLGIDQNLSK